MIVSSPIRQWMNDQRGQTTVLIALTMAVLMAFLALMVDVGQLVHDRILVQSVADMAALSAANVQATGLNELADLQWEYERVEDDLKEALNMGQDEYFSSQSEATNLVKYYTKLMGFIDEWQDLANTSFAVNAKKVAENILEWHGEEYGPNGDFGFKWEMGSGGIPQSRLINFRGTRSQSSQDYKWLYVKECAPGYCYIPYYVYDWSTWRNDPLEGNSIKAGVPCDVCYDRYNDCTDKVYDEWKECKTDCYDDYHYCKDRCDDSDCNKECGKEKNDCKGDCDEDKDDDKKECQDRKEKCINACPQIGEATAEWDACGDGLEEPELSLKSRFGERPDLSISTCRNGGLTSSYLALRL